MNVSCHGCGLNGYQLKECNKTSLEDKNNIYAMKKLCNFEAKNTGGVNTDVEGNPGDNESAASSVPISRSKHDRSQRFIGVCREDPVVLFNIGEEEEFEKDDAGFAFDFCIVGDVSLVDVKDECTSRIWISVPDVAEVGGLTFSEIEWKK